MHAARNYPASERSVRVSTLTEVAIVLDPRAEDTGELRGNGSDVGPLQGKKIGLKDGFQALYCILRYAAAD